MFRMGRLERMDLSRDNPAVDFYLRLEALSLRGLDDALVQMLWQSGNVTLLAEVEAASDANVRALNTAVAV